MLANPSRCIALWCCLRYHPHGHTGALETRFSRDSSRDFQLYRSATLAEGAGAEAKVAVVTGSSRGIGKAIALALGAKGLRVRNATGQADSTPPYTAHLTQSAERL